MPGIDVGTKGRGGEGRGAVVFWGFFGWGD